MRAVDWLLRLVLLVLSSIATLMLIGSLASVSNTSLGDVFPGRVASAPREAPPAGEVVVPERRAAGAAGSGTAATDADVPRTEDVALERWLKALTYAVLALAVFMAAGVAVLARIAAHLGRIAKAR